MPAKVNYESAWVNHTAGRSAQNGGSRTATRDTYAGCEVVIVPIPSSGHQCRNFPIRMQDFYNHTIILYINCCTTLCILVIQAVCASTEVILEPWLLAFALVQVAVLTEVSTTYVSLDRRSRSYFTADNYSVSMSW
jgi:hypothetical protein